MPRLEDEVREAREQVYFAYLRARERGVGLLDDPPPVERTPPRGDDAPA